MRTQILILAALALAACDAPAQPAVTTAQQQVTPKPTPVTVTRKTVCTDSDIVVLDYVYAIQYGYSIRYQITDYSDSTESVECSFSSLVLHASGDAPLTLPIDSNGLGGDYGAYSRLSCDSDHLFSYDFHLTDSHFGDQDEARTVSLSNCLVTTF